MTSIPWLTSSFISGGASNNSYGRSKSLGKDVTNLRASGSGFTANVYGSSTYYVEINVYGPEDLNCSCSCPDNRGGFCKHTCAVLTKLLPSNGGGGGGYVSYSAPVATSYSPKATSYSLNNTPSSPITPSGNARGLQDELSQLAQKYESSLDGSLVAKIACLIYKNTKEAVSNVKYNPNESADIMYQLLKFCYDYSRLFKQTLTQLKGSIETVAKGCSRILAFVVDTQRINRFNQTMASSRIHWLTSSENACWQDVIETITRKAKLERLRNYNDLLN